MGTTIEAIPFKRPNDDKENIKNIIVKNNYSKTNLGTISRQLDIIKKSIEKKQSIPPKMPSPQKNIKTPMLKPFQISNSSVKTYQDTNIEFIRALQSQLSKIKIGNSSMPQASDIPNTPTSKIQINTLAKMKIIV